MKNDSSVKFTALDYIDEIRVPGDVFSEPANEYWALVSLRDGLNFLYRQAAQCNEAVSQRLDPKVQHMITGNNPILAGIPQGLLTCAFHWYAISACQYVRTVGAIAYHHDNARPLPLQYVERVIPDVLAFRDKVAAHFAWTKKDSRDNEADRQISIMPQLTYNDDSFYIGGLKLTARTAGEITTSDEIGSWSITKVHADIMCKRYWPNQIPTGRLNVSAKIEGGTTKCVWCILWKKLKGK